MEGHRTVVRPLLSLGLLLAQLAWSSDASAEPTEGFGLAVGPVFHHAHETTDLGTGKVTNNFNSAGLGITGDAQFVLNANWSVNPFLQVSLERSSGDVKTNLGNDQAGLAIRRWSGNWYIAPILEISDEQFYQHHTVSRSLFGPGPGLGIGWESTNGLTLGLQLDAPQLFNLSGGDLHAGAWLSLGYRWH